MTRTIVKGDTILLDYTMRLENGVIIGSTLNSDPVEVVIGEGEIIPGIEKAVLKMKEGEQQTVSINYLDAYGPYQNELIQEIEISCLPNANSLFPGQTVEFDNGDDEIVTATVIQINDSTIKVDANHHLAGKNIIVDLRVIEVL